MTGAARSAPRALSWSEAHRLAGAEQLAPRAERRRVVPRLAVGPGPLAYVDGPGHGAGALRQFADAFAARLGVAAVAIRAPELELLGAVGAALAIASDEDAIALSEALATGELRRRPVLALAPGTVRNYFSRARLGRRRIVCGVGDVDSAQRVLAVATELAERLGAGLESAPVDAGLRHAVATSGASLVAIDGGPVVGAPARELIERGGVPVVLA